MGLNVPVTVKFPTTVEEAWDKKPFANRPKPENEVVAAVRVIVPSVALVIVSPLRSVTDVDEAIPFIWTTPSVALLMTSPLSKVSEVVVAPPLKVAKPVTPKVELIVTAPVKVLVSVTLNVPPVLMLVLIVDAAKVTAKTKTNDTNTDKAMEKILLLFINYLN